MDAELINELRSIKKEISFIKEHMVDMDSILSEEDYTALQDYRNEKKIGKLISHEKMKKELKVWVLM